MSGLRIAPMFSDSMVLQQQKRIIIFGEAPAGKTVEANLYFEEKAEGGNLLSLGFINSAKTTADENGKFKLWLPPMPYGTGFRLEIGCDHEKYEFNDIAFGEVYLAGGQSNMELELGNCKEAKDGIEELIPEGADIRYYYTQKYSYISDKMLAAEQDGAWQKIGDEWMKAWSATAFFFALKLWNELKVPVGIIGCNWGGTSAACWQQLDDLSAKESTKPYVKEYLENPEYKDSVEDQIKSYEKYVAKQAEWDRKAGELYATVPGISFEEVQRRIGKCLYPGPLNCASFLRPAGLYETMLKRVCPYTLRGFIYYQGESDDHRPDAYYDLMVSLIDRWRKDWGDDALPFILTQLPMHRYTNDADSDKWCRIREAQARVFRTVKNTGLAVAIDQGELDNIHPGYKRRVGERLAMQALCMVYGKLSEKEAFSPMIKETYFGSGFVSITFDSVDCFYVCERQYGDEVKDVDGINVMETETQDSIGDRIRGFEIAGADGAFYEADAEADGNSIILHCAKVPEPQYARYLWVSYSDVTLYGLVDGRKTILPVAPFTVSNNPC